MISRFRPTQVGCILFTIAIFFLAGGCSTEHYKAKADEEVYKIIDRKWKHSFGPKVNYTISDVAPSPNDIQVEKAVRVSGVITLAQGVGIATAHNRDYQSQKESLYLVALDLTLARHQFARQWFGTIDASYIRDSDDEIVGVDSGLGFNQLLATGAQISTNIAIDWGRFLTGDPRTSLASILSANVVQPLLRGSGREVVRENLTQAERNALYQIRSFSRYRKIFVVSIVADYYRVLQLKDTVTNAKNNYNRRIELSKRLALEATEGVAPQFQVDQAKQQELSARDSYIRAEQSFKQRLDEFKIRLALPTDADIELDPNELEALRKTGASPIEYTLADAVEAALVQRLDLANTAEEVEDSERKIKVAANNLGAELNLIGSISVDSNPDTDFTRMQFHEGTYGLGLEADLPFNRKAERNAYREALIAFQRQKREYENKVDTIKLEVRQAYRRLQEEADSYQTQKTAIQLAEKRVEVSPLLWEGGRLTTRDILESQDALVSAQNDLTAALIDHTIAKLNFFRDVGVLQVKPDGMWEQTTQ